MAGRLNFIALDLRPVSRWHYHWLENQSLAHLFSLATHALAWVSIEYGLYIESGVPTASFMMIGLGNAVAAPAHCCCFRCPGSVNFCGGRCGPCRCLVVAVLRRVTQPRSCPGVFLLNFTGRTTHAIVEMEMERAETPRSRGSYGTRPDEPITALCLRSPKTSGRHSSNIRTFGVPQDH